MIKILSFFMDHFTFHVVGLPHTVCSKEYSSCAFTQKVLNFCKMMTALGHDVYHYGGSGSEVECTEHIDILSEKDREKFFWKKDLQQFFNIKWNIKEPYWVIANHKTTEEIRKRIKHRDFICYIGGNCQQPIAEEFPEHMNVEIGIGYTGSFAPYRVFESYAWMHYTYGRIDPEYNGRFFDAVIPNYFDLWDFHYTEEKDDYLFFIWRMTARKGPHVAAQIAKEAGMKIKMAGQGIQKIDGNKYTADGIEFEGDHIEYLGAIGVEQRADVMSKAKATIVPTTYLEPFWGVSVESLLCGTPVIATDFWAFPEIVQHGKNGYRFRTLGEGIWAAQNLDALLHPAEIALTAGLNYSLEAISGKYQGYFEQLNEMWSIGWNSKKDLSMYPRYTKILH